MVSNFFPKIIPFMRYVEKYGRVKQAADDRIIRCMCIACWITEPTDKPLEYVIVIAFPLQQWLCEHA
jgi:hypothetical protein